MKKFIYAVLAFAPVLAFAQGTGNGGSLTGLETLVTSAGKIVGKIIPILFGLAILLFFWGVIRFVLAAGDPAKAKEGKSFMIWGIVGIAVMASVYGLVAFLQNAFLGGTGSTGAINGSNLTPGGF